MSDIVILNLVNDELLTNYAEFGNGANQDENLGTCTWDSPVYNSITDKYDVPKVEGLNVQGYEFNEGTLTDIPTEDRVNPTKVFKWIVRKIKGILCPTCM